MRKDRSHPVGTLHRLTLNSTLLAGNLLGDPTERAVDVYVPHGQEGNGLPLLVDLVGFTGSGLGHTNWKNFGENLPERLDRLIGSDAMPPTVVAFPDCFTRLGGNQYINSTALGPWEDVLIDEVLPLVEGRFGCGGNGRRGVFGKSSGGYGSMVHAMRRADTWSAAACHSGDMAFELCYLSAFPGMLRTLAKKGGSIEAFITDLESSDKPDDKDIHLLMDLAMAATYDPDPARFLGIQLPVDPDTCEVIEERWAKWLAWDPLRMARDHVDNLRSLKALFIDCGDVDQYDLVYGARRMHRELERLSVPHRYEEFPDNHSSIDYRMDVSLPILAKALTDG